MSDVAIRVENLSKRYRTGQSVGYQTLREGLVNVVSAPFRHFRSAIVKPRPESGNGNSEYIWALKDVSFEVRRGEAIGIIGRNGAGKTTLLKVLSRITEPTQGNAQIRGRVGSLLEVGTGFHPELTGRENVYLNGAVLGMKKKEINRKFDEIVEFAGVKIFIDTPLKRYSFGMQVRLAFAVAAYLEPEVLLMDEVLAVGDFEFQKKCLDKMQELSGGGRTVIFVSHNMGSIAALCPKTIWLETGQLAMFGNTREVISKYIGSVAEKGGEVSWDDVETAPGNKDVRLKAVRIKSNGEVTRDILIDQDIIIEIDYWNLKDGSILFTGINLRDRMNSIIFDSANWPSANLSEDAWAHKRRPKGLYRSTCVIPANFLNNDVYAVDARIADDRIEWLKLGDEGERILSFTIHESGEVTKEYASDQRKGVIRPKLAWSTDLLE